jgi:hypothetical protein
MTRSARALALVVALVMPAACTSSRVASLTPACKRAQERLAGITEWKQMFQRSGIPVGVQRLDSPAMGRAISRMVHVAQDVEQWACYDSLFT